MKQNIWDKANYYTNSSVGLDGFVLIQHEYFKKYNDYKSMLPGFPSSEEEASIMSFELSKPFSALKIYENMLSILACTSIESIVNAAGIHACTEKFYKVTIERNDIIGKIKLLILIINRVEILDDNDVLKILKNIFERRNSLVHPKSRHHNKLTNLSDIATDCFDINNDEIKKLLDDFNKILSFFVEYGIIPNIQFEEYQKYKYAI